jgi:PLP dependent protein
MMPTDDNTLVATLRARLADVRGLMAEAARRSGRGADAVRLVAVTKTHPPAVVAAAVAAGVTDVGENYLQEATEKWQALGWGATAPVTRHAIGHIQRNKAGLALQGFDCVQTVDSLRLAERLNRLAQAGGRILPVLLEINTIRESVKSGILGEEVEGMLPLLAKLPAIRVVGLMTIGQYTPLPEAARKDFAALRALRDRLLPNAPPEIALTELSMGMSHDFEAAIWEGATIVRVGTRLFVARPLPV